MCTSIRYTYTKNKYFKSLCTKLLFMSQVYHIHNVGPKDELMEESEIYFQDIYLRENYGIHNKGRI